MCDYTFTLMITTDPGISKQSAADDVLSALADASIAASLHEHPDEPHAAGWISVKTRVPDDERPVLCMKYNTKFRDTYFAASFDPHIGWTQGQDREWVDYWMELPDLPKELTIGL